MKSALKFLAFLSAANGLLLFMRPRDTSLNMLIWFPKMIAIALSAVMGIIGFLSMLFGLMKRDWSMSLAGFLSAGLAARYIEEIPDGLHQFSSVFGRESDEPQALNNGGSVEIHRNLVIGQKPRGGKPFLADLWLPKGSTSGDLGIIYVHGGGWRIGDKDMLTRPFFRRLAGKGYVILDIAYSLHPEADIPTMVREVNQAILWMKENSRAYGVDPERIVLMGGSAGAHLSLLAAYASGQPEFQPAGRNNNTAVSGVVAYYPVADLRETDDLTQNEYSQVPRLVKKLADGMFNRIFDLHSNASAKGNDHNSGYKNYLSHILGGAAEEIPEIYDLLSPITHVSKECPPTLLLHGSDDVFGLTAHVRCLHRALQGAGVPAVLVEYPHTEHGFDLILPQISPVAQAATREVERFLSLL